MLTPVDSSALNELCSLLRHSLHAGLVLAVEANAEGRGKVIAPDEARRFGGFRLQPDVLNSECRVLPATGMRFPAALSHGLGGPPIGYAWAPVPLDHAPGSGILLLWRDPATLPDPALPLHLPLKVFAELMLAQSRAVQHDTVQNRFDDLFDSVPSAILLVSGDGREALVNRRAADLLNCASGVQSAAEVSDRMRELRGRCDNAEELKTSYGAQMADVDYAIVMNWRLGAKTLEVDTHPVREDGNYGRIWLFTDITAEVVMANHLRRLAAIDPLTGIPNRRHFEERSVQIVAARHTHGNCIGILMIDIDHFKAINDSLGHAAGDLVLKEVARRCRDAVRDRDLFARFGGEEFVALLTLHSGKEIAAQAEALRRAVCASPVQIGDQSISVTVSIGASAGDTKDRFSVDHLMLNADAALYRAKALGRNRYVIFGDE